MKKRNLNIIIFISIIALLISICFVPINATRLIPVIEETITEELGVNAHIDKLILRVGPVIKLKAPIMHIMYEDGNKFAQIDNIKLYISWINLFKNKTQINKIKAKKITLRINSDDLCFQNLVKVLTQKELKTSPNISVGDYSLTYINKKQNDKYVLLGNSLEITKIPNYNNLNLSTKGSLSINSNKLITYDLNINPKVDLPTNIPQIDLTEVFSQIKDLDFHSDIIADIKLYKNQESVLQASGFVNIDNITVLDFAKKQQKSFVYLTLWGDKISVLSNIYTSLNNKVSIEGFINNSKKPVLDLKVKADNIDLNDIYKKLCVLTYFSQFKEIKALDGILNANFNLKGDINKIKSNGFLNISNARIKTSNIIIDKINSEMDFSNNIINIVKAIGYINESPVVAKGKIDKNIELELLMNNVDVKYLCPKSWNVKGGKLSIISTLSGTLNNINHKENVQLQDLVVEDKDILLNIESFKYDTNKSNTASLNNISCKTSETALIKIPSVKMFIDKDNIKIPETNVYMPNSNLVVKAELSDLMKDFSYSTVVNGFINSKDLTRFNKFSTRYPVKAFFYGNKISQNFNTQILFEKTDIFDEPALLNFVAKLSKNSLKIEDLSLISFNGKFVEDFKSNLKGVKKLIINGNIENINNPIMRNLRVFIPQQLNLHVVDTALQLKGDIFVNGKLEKPEIIGQISVQNFINQQLQLLVNNATLDFNKNNLIFDTSSFKLADSTMAINALLSNDILNDIVIKNLSIKSKYLNTDTILMYKDIIFNKNLPIKIQDGIFYSEKILANLYGSPIYLTAFSSNLSLDKNLIKLNKISSELYNGKIAGNIDYNLKDEQFTTDLMLRGVSSAPLFDIVSNRKETISGLMNLDAKISGDLLNKDSLNGNIKFVINNGRMSVLGKLEHLLYAQNILADNMLRTSLSVVTKAITLKDTGLFKYLNGDVTITNGIANINLLQSQGPLMSLFIKGQYNVLNDYANLVVLGRLSDEIISGLGSFGDFSFNKLLVMLTGEDTKYNIYPEDLEKIPELPVKNTKEFRALINGIIDKPSSVVMFNWIGYSQKSLKQIEKPMVETELPTFLDKLPY